MRGAVMRTPGETLPVVTLAVAFLGFFVVTFDAVVVNVALPTIRQDLGGGITGLQWVVDGYTLLFAALLLNYGRVIAILPDSDFPSGATPNLGLRVSRNETDVGFQQLRICGGQYEVVFGKTDQFLFRAGEP